MSSRNTILRFFIASDCIKSERWIGGGGDRSDG
jgi:hypothetical protein